MRILHTIHSVDPAGGGVIEAIKQVAHVHATTGHESEIVSLDAPGDPWARECPVKVHALGPGRTSYGYTPAFVPWLKARRRDYDAIIVNGLWQYNGFGTWRAMHGADTPYFVFPHGMLDPWFKRAYPLKHLKKWLVWPWADYRLLRDSRAVLFTCDEERRTARESFWLYRCREKVVNYGIATPRGDADVQKQAALNRFPELREKRVLLFLGRIHEKKGCDLLIKAFAKLLATPDPNLLLVFAGPDQTGWARELRVLADQLKVANQIHWAGMISGDIKWGMLRVAEAFVLPSHQENFGIAVAEALACETPALISNKVNIWREIAEDQAGFVDDDDEPGTTRILQRWFALDSDEKNKMRRNAGQSFQSRFEVTRTATALLDVIASEANRHS